MSLSNLPGLNNAESIFFGRLVAARTTIAFPSDIPSISFNIVQRTRSFTPTSESPLEPPMESISSMNKTQGAACLAF